MIKIHTIKLTKTFYVFAIILTLFLFINIVNKIMINHNIRQVVPVFSQAQKNYELDGNLFFLRSFFLKNLLAMEIPYLKLADESINSEETNFFAFITTHLVNIDINNPFSFIKNQIPYLASVEIQPVIKTHEKEEQPPNQREPNLEKTQQETENDEPEGNQQEDLKVDDKNNLPQVLIYHTHTTEAYSPTEKMVFNPAYRTFHTRDFDLTVVAVGEHLKKCLEEEYGIKVVHDKTIHDLPSYAFSYTNSLKTLDKNLKKFPSIKIAIDLHRDAPVPDPKRSREITTTKVKGKKVAKIMLVVGTDKLFEHPNWKKNYKFALALQTQLNKTVPSLTRKIDIREERFNQHLLDKAVLIEVGSIGNTIHEAFRAAEYLADGIAQVVNID